MQLAKTLKSIKKIKDHVLRAMVSAILDKFANSHDNSCELQISRNFFGYNWDKYKHVKTGKIISGDSYYKTLYRLRAKREEEKEFYDSYKPYYDYKSYEADLKRLKAIQSKLAKMGFKSKIIASEDYKTNSDPSSIWLTVRW